jgi:hypothetical protein
MLVYFYATAPDNTQQFILSTDIDSVITVSVVAYKLRRKYGSLAAFHKSLKQLKSADEQITINIHLENSETIKSYNYFEIAEEFNKYDYGDKQFVLSQLYMRALGIHGVLIKSEPSMRAFKGNVENAPAMQSGYSVATLRNLIGATHERYGSRATVMYDFCCKRYYLHISNNIKEDKSKTDVFIHLISI